MEPKDQVLKTAMDMFFRYGVKRVTMDDISREMGISKKTIYQKFKDKDDIIENLISLMLAENLKEIEHISAIAKDPVHEVIETGKYLSKVFSCINPVFIYEIKRYYPKAWKKLEHFKAKHIMHVLESNLKKGIELKIYRGDLNIPLMAHYRLKQFDLAFEPGAFPVDKLSLGEIQVQLLDHFLHGITTIKGHKLINKYKELQDEE